jgi:hypothetical protein
MDDIRLDSFTNNGQTFYTIQFVNINGNIISVETFDTENARATRILELQSESGESGI